MKKLLAYSMISFTLFALAGCGSNFPPDHRQLTPPVPSNVPTTLVTPPVSLARPGCKATAERGCISGQVIVAPYIYLDNQKYFDAEDLGRLFTDMVAVRDKSGTAADRSRYKIEISPQINNDTFTEEFSAYAKGSYAAQASVSSKGLFVLAGLDVGTYDLRVQKSFTMKVTTTDTAAPAKEPAPAPHSPVPTTPAAPSTPAASDQPAPTTPPSNFAETASPARDLTKVYCFTIYAGEDQIEVEAGQILHRVFDHFKLHMIDKECDKEFVQGPILTI